MKKYYKLLALFMLFVASLILLMVLYRAMYVYTLVRSETSFPLSLKWRVDLGRSTYERPAYIRGLVLFPASGTGGSHWYGINATTGRPVWSQQIERRSFRRCLTAEYLVLSGPWSFIILETQTGNIAWKKSYPAYTATCSEEAVFSSGVPRDSISAYNLSTGQQLWGQTEPRKSFHGLTYNPETGEIIAGHAEDFYIVEPQTGMLKRSFDKVVFYGPDDRGTERGPIYLIDRGELFIGGTVLDAKTGQVIHKEELYSPTPPTVTTDTMYLSITTKGVVAFDRTAYNIKWMYQPQHKFQSEPLDVLSPVVILNEIGYAIFSDATVRAFDLETGQELGYWQPALLDLWNWPICSFPPILCVESARAGLATSDDTLFVSFGDGKLYAFGR